MIALVSERFGYDGGKHGVKLSLLCVLSVVAIEMRKRQGLCDRGKYHAGTSPKGLDRDSVCLKVGDGTHRGGD